DQSVRYLTARYRFGPGEDILEPLEDGLSSRIRFTIELCERREGLFAFLGDPVVNEERVEYIGYRDFFAGVFVWEDEFGGRSTFASPREFLDTFRTLTRYPLPEPPPGSDHERFYIRVRVRINQVELTPPLTLIYLISRSGIYESEWYTVEDR
ncbi:MAG TPA: DUF4390 domain-containing protein, partial [Spirochaetia bacterium]|nr:DUF4390 domain-containing protein [Spirochaetia bacterium]